MRIWYQHKCRVLHGKQHLDGIVFNYNNDLVCVWGVSTLYSILFWSKRVVIWSERSFKPVLKWILKLIGEEDAPSSSPSALLNFMTWFLRIAGAFGAFGSAYLLYGLFYRIFSWTIRLFLDSITETVSYINLSVPDTNIETKFTVTTSTFSVDAGSDFKAKIYVNSFGGCQPCSSRSHPRPHSTAITFTTASCPRTITFQASATPERTHGWTNIPINS